MFLPNPNAREEREAKRRLLERIEQWGIDRLPADLRDDVQLLVQEIDCSDPACSPVDTIVTVVFASGGRGMLGLPMEAREITEESLSAAFPTEDILRKWHRGEDAPWPPDPDFEAEDEFEYELPQLRFELDTRVECRIGPSQWAVGTIVQLWYRETSWPRGSWAPYKVRLDDGRVIYAPGDMDQIIRKHSVA